MELGSLSDACAEIWKTDLWRLLIPRSMFALCTFSLPFLLKQIIDTIGRDDVSTTRKVVILTLTLGLFAGATVSKSAYAHMSYRLVTIFRASIITQLIDKTHNLSYKEARRSAAVSLMSTDIDGIAITLPRVMELPIAFLESYCGIHCLYWFIGASCYWIVVPILVSNIFTWCCGFWTEPASIAFNERVEKRVLQTSSMLYQLAQLKMLGLGPVVGDFLQYQMEDEMNLSREYRSLETKTVPLAQVASLMTPVLIICSGMSGMAPGETLSASIIFPSLALIASIQRPLGRFLATYSTLSAASSYFERLENFLSLPERDEYRIIKNKPIPYGRIPTVDSHERHLHPVEFADVDLAPLEQREPVLFRLDFSLIEGSITGIVGPPGTGKSTILEGILGEASLVNGCIYIRDEHMAICNQTTWLRDCSILENVIGPLPYDPDYFKRVIRCCLLQTDLQRLPGGADFIVGPGGKYLSIGQRQRLGIARAVYSRASVMLFDDPFGNLDRKTAVTIIYHLFGASGLLRERGITVALATNLRESLDVIDRVLLLDGRGYATLQDQPFQTPHFEAKVHNLLNSVQDGPSEEAEDAEQEAILRALEFEKNFKPGPTSRNVAEKGGEMSPARLYIKSTGYFAVTMYTLLVLCLSVGEHLPSIYLQRWMCHGQKARGFSLGYASIAATTCLIGTLSYWLLFIKLAPRAALDMHRKLVNAITGSTVAFLGVVNMGAVLAHFGQDTGQFSRQLPFYSMRAVYTFFTIAVKLAVILSGASYFVAILPLVVTALYYLQRFYFRASRQLRKLDVEAKIPLYKRLEESAHGVMYLRALRWLKADLHITFGLLNTAQRPFYYLYYIQQWLVVVLGLVSSGIAGALVAVALFSQGSTTEAAIGLSLFTLTQFSWTLERMFEVLLLLETAFGAIQRLRAFIQEAPQEAERKMLKTPQRWPTRGEIEIDSVTARYDPNSETAALKDVSIIIEAGEKLGIIGRTGSGKSSLIMAILGFMDYSGSIKIDGFELSMLPRDEVRSRLITISQDQVRLDASIRVNLMPFTMNGDVEKKKEKEEMANRRNEGGSHSFFGEVPNRETNITVNDVANGGLHAPDNPNANNSINDSFNSRARGGYEDDDAQAALDSQLAEEKDKQLEEILRRFGIWPHLMAKKGLDTLLGDAGYTADEFQLVCIARAILRQRETGSKVVLVDEATCSPDFWRGGFVQNIMREAFQSCTVLVVAHREETIWNASVVMEMSHGRIVHVAQRHESAAVNDPNLP